MRYVAFISYSTAADHRLAPALQQALHRFAKPWYRLRAIRVFRDKTGLAVTPALWPAIEQALGDSEFFLLLASPRAAQSVWVRREVDFWLTHRSPQRLLIIWTDGALAWDAAAGDFDWQATDALPQRMRGVFAQVPLYLDLRWARTTDDLSLRKPEFLEAVAALSSTLRDLPLDILIGQDVREHRRAVRLAWSAAILLAALTLLAGGLAYVADARRREAERQQNIALARQLAAQADVTRVQRASLIERSVLLALEGVRRFSSFETNQSLREAAALLPRQLSRQRLGVAPFRLALSDDGRLFAGASADGALRISGTTAAASAPIEAKLPEAAEALAFSPDGQFIAAVGHSGRSAILESSCGRIVTECTVTDSPRALALNRDASRMVVASGKNAGIWETKTGRCLAQVAHGNQVVGVAWSPDGGQFATASEDNSARIWNASTGEEVARFNFLQDALAVSFSPGGRYFAAASNEEAIVWARKDFQVIARLATEAPVWAMAFSPDEAALALGCADKVAREWIVATGREITRIVQDDDDVNALAFTPDGQHLVTADEEGSATTWEAASGAGPARMTHPWGVWSLGFSPDGRQLVTASDGDATRLWEVAAGKELRRWIAKIGPVHFSPRGRWLETVKPVDGSGSITTVLDAATGAEATLPGLATITPEHFCFSSDDRFAVAVDDAGGAIAWDIAAGQEAGRFSHAGLLAMTNGPAGTILTAGSDGAIRSWQLPGGREIRNAPCPGDARGALFSADASLLAVVIGEGEKREVQIHDLAGLLLARWPHPAGIETMIFSADGSRLAVRGEDGIVRLWLAREGRLTAAVQPGTILRTMALAPDGATLVTGDNDKLAILWDTATGRQLARLRHDEVVVSAAFSHDSRRLATGSIDGLAQVWLVQPEDVLAAAKARVSREFTPEERALFLGSPR